MRELSLDELDLIFGAGNLDTVVIEGNCTGCNEPPDYPDYPDWPDPGDGGGESGGGGGGGEPTPRPPQCVPAEPIEHRYDIALLERHEGGRINVGYVPSSNSGVTVGAGVDLARWMPSDLRNWGISTSDVATLTPFLATGPGAYGPRGATATALLPFSVSNALRDALSDGARQAILNQVNSNWTARNTVQPNGSFYNLPAPLQTVLLDISYVMGPNLHVSGNQQARDFYAAFTAGRFGEAANLLSALGVSNQRFKDLSAILNAAISNNEVPIAITTTCN